MPERPNTKEDADRTSSATPRPTVSQHQQLMDWYRKNANYIDPKDGWMYFDDNYRVNSGGTDIRYPNGQVADAIPIPGTPNPIKPTLGNRYAVDPPLPQTLGNRYSVTPPDVWEQARQRIGVAYKALDTFDTNVRKPVGYTDELMELARRSGYLK